MRVGVIQSAQRRRKHGQKKSAAEAAAAVAATAAFAATAHIISNEPLPLFPPALMKKTGKMFFPKKKTQEKEIFKLYVHAYFLSMRVGAKQKG